MPIAAEKQIAEDAATIVSLRTQLREAEFRAEEIRRQAMEDYLKSHEFEDEKIQIFRDGSKPYQR